MTSFLLALTFMENNTSSFYLIIGLVSVAIVSLVLFITIEKKTKAPLIDFKVLLHKSIFPANIMVMIVGLSMFMVFQTALRSF